MTTAEPSLIQSELTSASGGRGSCVGVVADLVRGHRSTQPRVPSRPAPLNPARGEWERGRGRGTVGEITSQLTQLCIPHVEHMRSTPVTRYHRASVTLTHPAACPAESDAALQSSQEPHRSLHVPHLHHASPLQGRFGSCRDPLHPPQAPLHAHACLRVCAGVGDHRRGSTPVNAPACALQLLQAGLLRSLSQFAERGPLLRQLCSTEMFAWFSVSALQICSNCCNSCKLSR